MSDLLLADPAPPEAPATSTELAASLVARLCHDLISPASAIVSGVDLLEDPTAADMKDDALSLISQSARKMVSVLAFSRVAFGGSASAENFQSDELRKLSEGIFASIRPNLDWAVGPAVVNKPAARALLNLAQLGSGCVARDGVVRVEAHEEGGDLLMSATCTGTRVKLRDEVATGLRGEPLGEGLLHGHWVQAFYVHSFLEAAGGAVDASVSEDRAVIRARAPL